jgi:hypothetical protein
MENTLAHEREDPQRVGVRSRPRPQTAAAVCWARWTAAATRAQSRHRRDRPDGERAGEPAVLS